MKVVSRIKRLLAAALCPALMLAGCGGAASSASQNAAEAPQRYTTIFYDAFDTVTQVIAYCDSEEEFNAQMDALHQDLLAYHRLYDIYNDYEGVINLKTINDNAGKAPVKVDSRILEMLELAQQMYDTTGGKLNVAMGSVLRVWHDYRDAAGLTAEEADNALPSQAELDAAAQHCGIEDLHIDKEAQTVYLSDPEMSLDVGSVGKGYAVEMVCRAAQARGLTSALVSVGGNLRAIGTKPGGVQWSGGVENPLSPSQFSTSSSYLAAVNISDLAMVTSGNYQRYYIVDGTRYHHLIDPDTLWPAGYFDSVCVICPDSGVADCLSTGLFCSSLEEGLAIVEALDGVEALWSKDGQVIATSSGWEAHEKK
ncbi:MAG: FAD:protein FMN transferase [Faecalibacterium sp.]